MKALYRANFFYTVAGIEYSVNYFNAESRDKYFTETIYRLPEGKPINRQMITYQVPTAELALISLNLVLNKQQS